MAKLLLTGGAANAEKVQEANDATDKMALMHFMVRVGRGTAAGVAFIGWIGNRVEKKAVDEL